MANILVGTDNIDNIPGTNADDLIYGLAGNDILSGSDGNDILYDGLGDDDVWGGNGVDVFNFIDGNNLCNDLGTGGSDILIVSVGADVQCSVLQGSSWSATADTINDGVVAIFSSGGNVNLAQANGVGRFIIYNTGAAGATFVGSKLDDLLRNVSIHATEDIFFGGAGDDSLDGGLGNDKLIGGSGADTFNIASGSDQIWDLGFGGSDRFRITGGIARITVTANWVAPFTTSNTSAGDGNVILTTSGFSIDLSQADGGSGYWIMNQGSGTQLKGSSYDDTIIDGLGSNQVYGVAGNDKAIVNYAWNEITAIGRLGDGGKIQLRTNSSEDYFQEIDTFRFSDAQTFSAAQVASSFGARPLFGVNDTASGYAIPDIFNGPVDFLEYQYLGNDTAEIVVGAWSEDFISLSAGDDAVDGGSGRDVLDGGTGSSFLTGGWSADVFFIDGRNAVATWSTITDFSKLIGDTANMWGWRQGVSQLITNLNDGGAAGYTGATYHYDLDGNSQIDTSVTFTGLTTAQVGSPTVNSVAGNGYLLFA